MEVIRKRLEDCTTTEEAFEFVRSLNLTCKELKILLEMYKIPAVGNKEQLMHRLVEGVVGSRIRFDILLTIPLK